MPRKKHPKTKSVKKLKSKLKSNKTKPLVFAVVFAGIAATLLFATHALTPTPSASIEPENGTLTGPVVKFGNDSSASNNGYVKFGPKNRERLGVDINTRPSGVSLTQAYDKIASLGFGWVRTGPSMTNYHNSSNLDTNFDNEIKLAKDRNLKIMAVITYAYSDCSGGHCAPSDPAAYAHYAGLLVAHWKATYPGVVQAVEIWNEANNPQFWNPVDPVKYTDLLKRSYLEVKVADPNMIVVASGPAPGGGNTSADASGTDTTLPRNPATWFKQLYANGARGFFDAAANHPYDTKNLTTNTTQSGLRNTFWIRQVMNANGENSKKIWSTEAGVTSCLKGPGSNPPMTEQQRSDRIIGDLQDFWYGVHDQTDGHTTGSSTTSDWGAGPYFVFKLYKSTGDSGLGIIYNTNSYMNNPPSSELPNSGGDSEPLCTSSPDYYVPQMGTALQYISALPQ